MRYAVETLEIELARLRRGIRALEVAPGVEEDRLPRLNRYVDEIRDALRTLHAADVDPGRPLEGFPEYAVETLRVERGRLLEVIRSLRATREEPGIAYPAERIAEHEGWLAEVDAAIPALEGALQARLSDGGV